MAKEVANRAIAAICSRPWAITPAGLNMIIAIAERTQFDIEAAQEAREKRDIQRSDNGYQTINGVAVVPIIGSIIPYASFFAEISGATSVASITRKINAALDDPAVTAIVLNIDSPGGDITGIHELADMIYEAREIKTITAYVGGMGASAAYWIASAATEVVADKTALLGSIGVLATWEDNTAQKEGKGIKSYSLVSSQSPNKRLDPATDAGRQALQDKIDALAEIFIADVARNRGMESAQVQETFGAGDVVLAEPAISAGMADRLGSFDSVISSLSSQGVEQWKGVFMAQRQTSPANPEGMTTQAQVTTQPEQPTAPERANQPHVNTLEEFRLWNALGAQALKVEGVLEERARLQAIDEIGLAGYDALILEAKYKNPLSAEQLSVQILRAEKAKQNDPATKYQNDARAIAGIPSSPMEPGPSTDADQLEAARLLAEVAKQTRVEGRVK